MDNKECGFCKDIYESEIDVENDCYDSWCGEREVYVDSGIVRDGEEYEIFIPDPDSSHSKSLTAIKYCPYCGRKII